MCVCGVMPTWLLWPTYQCTPQWRHLILFAAGRDSVTEQTYRRRPWFRNHTISRTRWRLYYSSQSSTKHNYYARAAWVNIPDKAELSFNLIINKKLSYHRDSARRRRWWLRLSRPFKVIDVSTNRNPVSYATSRITPTYEYHHAMYWSNYLLLKGRVSRWWTRSREPLRISS